MTAVAAPPNYLTPEPSHPGFETGRRASTVEHVHSLLNPLEGVPAVIVFFSFMDSKSYRLMYELDIGEALRSSVRQGTEVSEYHSPMRWSWGFGEDLTHAWAAAQDLQVDAKVMKPLFDAVFTKRTVTDLEGLRTVFEENADIPPEWFLQTWGKAEVIKEKKWMYEAVERVGINDLPCIVVNGRHVVSVNTYDRQFDTTELIDLVKDLLEKE